MKALAAGVKLPEFEQKVLHMVEMAGDRRSDPDMVFNVLRRATDEWNTVEIADKARVTLKKRLISKPRGNQGTEVNKAWRVIHSHQRWTKHWGCDKAGYLR